MQDGRVVFTSTRDGDLDLYVVNPDATGLRRLTDVPGYDGFPMFSPDGRWLVFASNRAGGHQTNLYIARWVP